MFYYGKGNEEFYFFILAARLSWVLALLISDAAFLSAAACVFGALLRVVFLLTMFHCGGDLLFMYEADQVYARLMRCVPGVHLLPGSCRVC